MAERMGASRQSYHAMKQAELVFLHEESLDRRSSTKSGKNNDQFSHENDKHSICHLYKW